MSSPRTLDRPITMSILAELAEMCFKRELDMTTMKALFKLYGLELVAFGEGNLVLEYEHSNVRLQIFINP